MKVFPLQDQVLVKRIKISSRGGIIVPGTAEDYRYEVVAIGPEITFGEDVKFCVGAEVLLDPRAQALLVDDDDNDPDEVRALIKAKAVFAVVERSALDRLVIA
jgi:co-chaperonin GroES (HSP10)